MAHHLPMAPQSDHAAAQQEDLAMPYLCPYCSRRFRRRDGLVLHVRTHTGERPYACPHCRVAFAQKSHLNRHIRTVHKVEPNAHLIDPPGTVQPPPPPPPPHVNPQAPHGKAPWMVKVDGHNGEASDIDLSLPSAFFPHVQISADGGAAGVVAAEDKKTKIDVTP
ncbi:Gastrula zinc finger protein XlCGF9.1 [Portunus trituberculatus]|uniref:Gastrula zinc finger protein XlCGF9.1 n=2 Tax=Portunus trituberculatus TaxID=210409 RepID=A0A5B7HPR8_PORTR|nr:Gastrula zinc finger protein XlCGF9.1 [Portunus trituberculatus]